MWEMWIGLLGREDPLEEGTEIHSSILAWRIPWTEEPGGLQSMGPHRVGHDWSNLAHMHTLSSHLLSGDWDRREKKGWKCKAGESHPKLKKASAPHRQNPSTTPGKLGSAMQETTALPTDPELLLSTALRRTKASQPISSASSTNAGGKALKSGRNPGSGSGTVSISQEWSGLPVAWAEIRSSWQRLAERALSQPQGWAQEAKTAGRSRFPE